MKRRIALGAAGFTLNEVMIIVLLSSVLFLGAAEVASRYMTISAHSIRSEESISDINLPIEQMRDDIRKAIRVGLTDADTLVIGFDHIDSTGNFVSGTITYARSIDANCLIEGYKPPGGCVKLLRTYNVISPAPSSSTTTFNGIVGLRWCIDQPSAGNCATPPATTPACWIPPNPCPIALSQNLPTLVPGKRFTGEFSYLSYGTGSDTAPGTRKLAFVVDLENLDSSGAQRAEQRVR